MAYKILLIAYFLIPILSFSQKIDSLDYGFGGGFTGKYTIYRLKGEKLFKGNSVFSNDYSEMSTISKHKRKIIIRSVFKLISSGIRFDMPQNFNTYLVVYTKNGTEHFTWGRNENELPEKINKCDKIFQKIIQSTKFETL